jgi:hypothetical protein
MDAARLPHMLAQQLTVARIEQAHKTFIPLHLDRTPDPAWRCTVVGGFDFHAAVQMNTPLAELIVAEWLDRQRL